MSGASGMSLSANNDDDEFLDALDSQDKFAENHSNHIEQ